MNIKKIGITLTKDQSEGLKKLLDWSENNNFKNNDNIFVLSGAAGTGKSTLVKEFLTQCKIKSGVIVSAPTHPAVAVISNFTNRAGYTIHKLCGFRPDYNIDDFDINNLKFAKLGVPHIGDYKLIVIDEAGMLNNDLDDYVAELATVHKVKILYVGDHLQLPPPQKATNKVKKEHISIFQKYNNKYVLHEVVRQDDSNPVTLLLAILRYELEKTVYNEEFLFNTLERFKINPNYIKAMKHNRNSGNLFIDFTNYVKGLTNTDGIGFSVYTKEVPRDYEDFVKKVVYNMQNTLKDVKNPSIFLAYKNDTVEQWNKYIRNFIFNTEESIIVNDLFYGYETILDEFNVPLLFNSEEYLITSVEPYVNSYGIDGFLVNMKSLIDGTELLNPLFIVDQNNENNLHKYIYHYNELLTYALDQPKGAARGKAFGDFYSFKRQNLLYKTIFDEMGNYVSKKSLDYGYCTTIHKSQGRTYNNVLINMKDIIMTTNNTLKKDKDTVKRLLYVAVSRAKNNVYILK